MNEILWEILNDAQTSGRITLLNTLHSYKKVIDKHEMVSHSDEGTEIYKTLLRWGREKNVNWHKKYSEMFNKSEYVLEVKDLEVDSTKYKRDSPPTHDSPSNTAISFPRFKEFKAQLKEPKPNATLAMAFCSLRLRRKSWEAWKIYSIITKEETELERKIEAKKEKNRQAWGFYEESLKRKSLEGWTKLILCSIRKNIAEKARITFWTKMLWRGWRKALKKKEILKGMKFTAYFIHNQWLMKKVVLTLARRVHSSMMQRIKQSQIIESVNRLKAGKVIDSWKLYVNLRLKSKIFYLKSQKFTIKYLLARGLRKLQLGIEVNKAQQDLIERANTHYKKKLFTKTIHVWFSSIVNNCRKKIKIEQAEKFYEDRLKNWVFQCLKFISEYWQTEFEEKINEYKKKKTNNILVQWRSKSVNNLNKIFPGFFYYIVFYLLMPYSQIPINKFEFSNISQRINRKKIAQSNNLLKTYVNDKLFTRWKNYTITIKSKTNLHTAQKDPNIKVAAEYHQSNLISSVFYAWDSLISQHSVKRRRALLHSIFLEWKIATRENSLLQKYLLKSGYLKDI